MRALVELPEIILEVNGAPLSPEDTLALGGLQVRQRLSLPTLCEFVFYDPQGPIAEPTGLELGSRLRVSVAGQLLFSGQVTAIDYVYGPSQGREVRVRGYDVLHQLRKRQPIRAHVQLTLLELARELVAGLDLAVETTEPGPVWHKLVQHRQSDLELMTEVAERCGLYFTLQDRVLHFVTLKGKGNPIALMLGESLLEVRIDINTDPACRRVTSMGWNPWRAQAHQSSAGEPRVGRQLTLDFAPAQIGGSGERTLVNESAQDDAQTEVMAQAMLDQRVAGEVCLRGVAEGDPGLQPGTPIMVNGVAQGLTGRYTLSAVNHIIDRRKGYICEIGTSPPRLRKRSQGTTTTVGVVTQIEDPEGLGRVKVSLPSYNDIESDWLEIVIPAAGPDKGMIALPDLQDRVLVLLVGEDPAQGVVLGGLYGTQEPPDTGVEDGAVRRYTLLTPGGQRVQLDDKRGSVKISNQRGHSLELTPGKVRLGHQGGSCVELLPDLLRIHAETDLEIEAPGKAIVIRGQAIDFERG